MNDLFFYFTDPILRAPTLGSMLMGISAGIVGTIAVLRKESLIGEALSHAAYPGLIAGMLLASSFEWLTDHEEFSSLLALVGGLFSALAAIWIIYWMENKLRVSSDASLCFILASTFGLGVTLASHLQFNHAAAYRNALALLYGQAATMTNWHLYLYMALAVVILISVFVFYKEILVITFDRDYAATLGIRVHILELLLFILISLTVIIGIRTVGIVLMSAMLIAPAVAARQFSNTLWKVLALASLIGMISGFFGNYLSLELSNMLTKKTPGTHVGVPTGPMIALTASAICLCSLLCAPHNGWITRQWRILRFRYRCLEENALKWLWRNGKHPNLKALGDHLGINNIYLNLILRRLGSRGWLSFESKNLPKLTVDGHVRATKIIRLHRLWEVYLAEYLGVGVERVHCSAEEMEHVITPELERELTALLDNPKIDPHHQPIPPQQMNF